MRDYTSPDEHPLDVLSAGGALTMITRVEGTSFRDPGTMMAVLPSGTRIGDLTSGCIEADVTLHAQMAMEDGRKRVLRYGEGSEFADLKLPCGGALEVTVLPNPDRATLARAAQMRAARIPFTLLIDDALRLSTQHAPGWHGDTFATQITPEPRFLVIGTGTEAKVFARAVQGAGFDAFLTDRVDHADSHTAIALFFHDHDREIPLLLEAIRTDAFYIGAQGSLRASAARRDALLAAGAAPEAVARIHGPVGLIRQARDSRVLAVSVLAQVLDIYRRRS